MRHWVIGYIESASAPGAPGVSLHSQDRDRVQALLDLDPGKDRDNKKDIFLFEPRPILQDCPIAKWWARGTRSV